MGLFSKKDKVPEIPPAPKLPDFPNLPDLPEVEDKEVKELPRLPDTNFGETLNNEMVKSAVDDSEKFGENLELREDRIPSPPQLQFHKSPSSLRNKFPHPEKNEHFELHEPHKKRTLELSPQTKIEEPSTKPNEPIFVRIDKFQQAQKDFNDIKKKVKDIELTLKKFKEVKFQEDTEVVSWTQNLEKIKARLENIERQIFSKI